MGPVTHQGSECDNSLFVADTEIETFQYLSQNPCEKECGVAYALFYTKTGRLQIRQVRLEEIDADFAVAQKLTQQKIHEFIEFASASRNTAVKDSVLYLLKSFEDGPFYQVLDIIPFLRRFMELIEEERVQMSDKQEIRLVSLFSQLKNLIQRQYVLYDKCCDNSECDLPDRAVFETLVEEIMSLRLSVEAQFPHLNLPAVLQHQFFDENSQGCNYFPDDCLSQLTQYFTPSSSVDVGDGLRLINALSDEAAVWDRLLKCDPSATSKDVFSRFCEELNKYESVERVPEYLMKAFKNLRYLDVGELLKLRIVQNSEEVLMKLIEECSFIQLIKIGNNVPESFLDTYFSQIVDPVLRGSLQELDLSQSLIQDRHFINIPSSHLRTINLAETAITGECLRLDIFKEVEIIDLSSCKKLLDQYLSRFSSRSLKTATLSETKLTGECLSSDAFQTVEKIDLSSCKKLQDEFIATLSAHSLREINLSTTRIRGECLSSPVFSAVQTLLLAHCNNLSDDAVSKLPSFALKTIDLKETPLTGACLSSSVFRTVEDLNLSFCANLDEVYLYVVSSESLRSLNVSSTSISGEFLALPKFYNLQALYLSFCIHLTDEAVFKISSRSLKTLELGSTLLTGECFSSDAFKTVQSLNLRWCECLEDQYFFELQSESLRTVNLSLSSITGECLSSNVFRTVETLNLSGCEALSERGVAALSAVSLKNINLSRTSLTGECLSSPAFETVQSLNLWCCKSLEDRALSRITSHSLHDLNLSLTPLRGECFSINAFKSLKVLDLSDCKQITPSSLTSLTATNLERIQMRGTGLTRKHLPHAILQNIQMVRD